MPDHCICHCPLVRFPLYVDCCLFANGISRRIVATANGFLNFLGGYSIFQGPVVAIMIVDYFMIRRGNISMADLYTFSSSARYYFFHGINVRAFAAFVIGFLLPLPGFIGSFGVSVDEAASHMYALGWVLSFVIGGLAYWIACLIFKMPGTGVEKSLAFEQLVAEAEQLVYDGNLGEFVGNGPVLHGARSSINDSETTEVKRAEGSV